MYTICKLKAKYLAHVILNTFKFFLKIVKQSTMFIYKAILQTPNE